MVGDREGRSVDHAGAALDGSATLAASARALDGFCELGGLLGLGALELFTTKAPTVAYVVARDGPAVVAVALDPNRPTAPVEAAIRTTTWTVPVEWDVADVSDAEIEYVNAATGSIRRPAEVKETAPPVFEDSPTRPGRWPMDGIASAPPPSSPRLPAEHASARRAPTIPARPAQETSSSLTVRPAVQSSRPPNARSATRLLAASPAFTGSLETIGLADLLEFLRNGQRTGALVCGSKAAVAVIHMRTGNVMGAMLPHAKPLSDYLLAGGHVTAQVLDALTHKDPALWTRPTAPVELAKSGVATVGQIRHALGQQIRAVLRELVTWTHGDFSFDSDNPLPPSSYDAALSFETPALLMDIFNDLEKDATASS